MGRRDAGHREGEDAVRDSESEEELTAAVGLGVG